MDQCESIAGICDQWSRVGHLVNGRACAQAGHASPAKMCRAAGAKRERSRPREHPRHHHLAQSAAKVITQSASFYCVRLPFAHVLAKIARISAYPNADLNRATARKNRNICQNFIANDAACCRCWGRALICSSCQSRQVAFS